MSIARRKVSGIYISRVLHAVEHAESSHATQREGVYGFIRRIPGDTLSADAEVTLSRVYKAAKIRGVPGTRVETRGDEKWSEEREAGGVDSDVYRRGNLSFAAEFVARSSLTATVVILDQDSRSCSPSTLFVLVPDSRRSPALPILDVIPR